MLVVCCCKFGVCCCMLCVGCRNMRTSGGTAVTLDQSGCGCRGSGYVVSISFALIRLSLLLSLAKFKIRKHGGG